MFRWFFGKKRVKPMPNRRLSERRSEHDKNIIYVTYLY